MKQIKHKSLNVLSNVLIFSGLLALISSCSTEPAVNITQKSLIPLPVSVTPADGAFKLIKKTRIYVSAGSEELVDLGNDLAAILKPATGFPLEVIKTDKERVSGNIFLTIESRDGELGEEGYEMVIAPKGIQLKANQPAGLFHAIQTLRQLLPDRIEKDTPQPGPWLIPAGTIRDYPSYAYRGTMLDVARHFFKPEDVKKYIDEIAFFKLNFLHLHLSDDQGWRIEIKSWPKLATYGGSTEVGGGKGGYYTQKEYKDIVQYARKRYITIIPEIDMPGHTNAALASYTELNCNGKATDLYTETNVGFSTLCTHKKITYKFIDDVIGELAAMTPGPYIHIGGDESHATPMKDYIPFVNRVQQIVLARGKKIIGWDEIANATLARNTTVQYWEQYDNALKGVAQNARVIMSPANKTYLDIKYDSTTTLGLHWAGYVEVDSAYIWDPATLVPGITKKDILGIESPLWSETITNMKDLEYMVFPRLAGHAEIGWTPADKRSWKDYKVRLGKFGRRFDAMGINYYHSKLVPWTENAPDQ